MLIQQRRIRNLDRHLPNDYKGKELRLGTNGIEHHRSNLERAGFSPNLNDGERVLPGHLGPVSRFNAEGKPVRRRDLEMEYASRMIEWHWTEYHGKDQVERSDFRFITYKRYPRDQVPPPSIELEIVRDTAGNQLVVTDSIPYDDANAGLLLHAINLCLELFGECHVFTDDLAPVIRAPLRRLNWHVLPPGRHPWADLRRALAPAIEQAKKGNRPVASRRLETVNDYEPEFAAVGHGGFTGYVILGFPKKNLYVCESTRYGNATYVFEEEWEELSQLSKGQILAENRQKERIVHSEGWPEAIRRLLA
jgi:hypothetical protein